VAPPRSRKQVTTLQRAVGNAAVRTLLQRIEPSVQRQPAPAGASDAQFQKAVASSDWTGAAIAVNGVNDADFLRLLRGQPPASASRIYTAALRTMTGSARDRFTTLVPQVGNQIAYDGALAAPDWLWVGLHLNGFLDADIATRVAALNPAQRQLLREAIPSVMWRVRTPVLVADFKAAVGASDWSAAATAINGLFDGDFLVQLRSIPVPQVSQVYTAALRIMTEDTRERFVTLVPQVDLGAAATGAIVASAWSEAGRHLLMFTDANLNTRVIAMTQADRLAMLPYVPAWNFRARQALLRAVATTEIAASDWGNAVQHLNGLFEADLLAVLTSVAQCDVERVAGVRDLAIFDRYQQRGAARHCIRLDAAGSPCGQRLAGDGTCGYGAGHGSRRRHGRGQLARDRPRNRDTGLVRSDLPGCRGRRPGTDNRLGAVHRH
jgi:hypothetical protein